MAMYNVNNVSKDYANHKYVVVRECDKEYWYYGSYDTLERAQEVCKMLGNGLVVESERVKVEYFN